MFSYVLSVLEGTIEVKLPTIWTDEKQINYNYTSMIKQYTYNPTNLTNHGYPEYSTVWISQVISQVIGDIPTDWLSLTLVPLASMKRSIYRKEMLAKPKQTWWRHLMRTKETNDECFIVFSACSLTCLLQFNGTRAELNGFSLVLCPFTEQKTTVNSFKSISNIQAIRRDPNQFTMKAASQETNSNSLRIGLKPRAVPVSTAQKCLKPSKDLQRFPISSCSEKPSRS